jgi:hypothetical protein
VSADGRTAGALGYINNVHPETQGRLHNALCETLSHFLPLFEKTLGDLKTDFTHCILAGQSIIDDSNRPVNPVTGEPCEPWDDDCEDDVDSAGETEQDSDGDSLAPKASVWKTWMRTQPYKDPLPPVYSLPERRLGSGASLKGTKIQVIFKIAEMYGLSSYIASLS